MSEVIKLSDGHVVITGMSDGKEVTVEGDIESASLRVEHSGEDMPISRLVPDVDYHLWFRPSRDGTAFTLNKNTTKVERSAIVQATDRTLEALEKARQLAGAPSNAKMRIQPSARDVEGLVLDMYRPTVVTVEFRWLTHE